MFSGVNNVNKSKEFVGRAQNARQVRAEERRREQAAVKIQSVVRRYLTVSKLRKNIWEKFDSLVVYESKQDGIRRKVPAMAIFDIAKDLLFIYKHENAETLQQFQQIFRVILFNLENESDAKYWYMSVMLSKQYTVQWMQQLKKFLHICCRQLKKLKSGLQREIKAASICLSMIVVFTDCKGWKILQIKGGEKIQPAMQQLCVSMLNELVSRGLYSSLEDFFNSLLSGLNPQLNNMLLTAGITMSFRPLIQSQFAKGPLIVFILHILSVPAITLHLKKASEESFKTFIDNRVLYKLLEILANKQDLRIIFNSLEGNRSLCLLGNLVDLAYAEIESKSFSEVRADFVEIVLRILQHCQSYVVKKQSNLTKWHPILGWFMQTEDTSWISDTMTHVTLQLQLLWKRQMVDILFAQLPSLDEDETASQSANTTQQRKAADRGLFKRAFGRSARSTQKSTYRDLKDPVVLDVCQTCEMYQVLAATLTQLKMDIFAALSLNEQIIVRLWKFLYTLGPDGGLKAILSYVTGGSDTLPDALNALLTLFCDCCSQLLPILDDAEFYELQKPFTIDESIRMSAFLNSLVFKIIWARESEEGAKAKDKSAALENSKKDSHFLSSALMLLMLLYDRDCRRSFAPAGHWIIKEIKTRHFLADLDSNKRRALVILKKVPHVIPHHVRVQIFRQWVEDDKESLGIFKDSSRPTALITIYRGRLLEDGYEQLCRLDGQSLKGIIRVKFVNQQGLDEAGIDQDGVFKEYLEDTITRAFDPQLNLFKMTEEQKLYPSSTSFIHENHLQLFEFIGKMLGKAIYEGILVDVPFAPFFLSQLLGRQHGVLYSSIDELPSLDKEMYKNLCFIKNYNEDVDDLELTFSYDEDVLGKIVTHDLKPGGRAIKVTNANKLSYIHLMAKFRMSTHIKDVTAAFTRGFRSIINMEWLRLFSPPEFQRLISGDTGAIDLQDLK